MAGLRLEFLRNTQVILRTQVTLSVHKSGTDMLAASELAGRGINKVFFRVRVSINSYRTAD